MTPLRFRECFTLACAGLVLALVPACNEPDLECDSAYYEDLDHDGYGDRNTGAVACRSEFQSPVQNGDDCDDADAAVSPEADEVCNGIDDDCDELIDAEDDSVVDATIWYQTDQDGDGYGVDALGAACEQPSSDALDQGGDCDDADDAVNPGADEVCNQHDDDCDDLVDDDDDSLTGGYTWYVDTDSDDYGSTAQTHVSCEAPPGYVDNDDDCADDDADTNPGVPDVCDDADNDCDGSLDEDPQTWYQDVDQDGYGAASNTTAACDRPDGYVANASDCNDLSDDVHPGAAESCNQYDDDCDGTADDGLSITAIAAGYNHSLALCSSGEVLAWGENARGQLGDGTDVDKQAPVLVKGLEDVVAIAAGELHSVALRSDRSVWAWGENSSGQLGDATLTDSLVPVQVRDLENVQQIASGYNHVVALDGDYRLHAWGNNDYGQIGDGTKETRSKPVLLELLGAADMAAGANHTLVLMSDRTGRAWGRNTHGELGDGTNAQSSSPVAIKYLTNITVLVAGESDSLASASGATYGWGDNDYNQSGAGSPTSSFSEPTAAFGGDGMVSLAAGRRHVLSIDGAGHVWGWGDNGQAQVTTRVEAGEVSVPFELTELAGTWTAVAAGGSHSLALSSDGKVMAWGNNQNGQLGDGTKTDPEAPVAVIDLP